MTVHTLDLAAYDRGAERSASAVLMDDCRSAAIAAVRRAPWLRALRLDASEAVADATANAALAVLETERVKRRKVSESERREIAADHADAFLADYRRAARSAVGGAFASGADDPAAAGLDAAATLAAERGAVLTSRKGDSHLGRDLLDAAEPLTPRSVQDATILAASGATIAALADATDRQERGIKRQIAEGRKRLESATFTPGTFWRIMAALGQAEAERDRLAAQRDDSPAANGYCVPHAAGFSRPDRVEGPTLPVRERRQRPASAALRAADGRKRQRRLSRREWREANAAALTALERSLYGSAAAVQRSAPFVDRAPGAGWQGAALDLDRATRQRERAAATPQPVTATVPLADLTSATRTNRQRPAPTPRRHTGSAADVLAALAAAERMRDRGVNLALDETPDVRPRFPVASASPPVRTAPLAALDWDTVERIWGGCVKRSADTGHTHWKDGSK